MNTLIITKAIENRSTLTFDYNGSQRIVEPHAYGVSKKGEDIIRAYQSNGTIQGWRLFTVDKMENIYIGFPNRDGYKTNDSAMTAVFTQVEA